MDNRLATLCGDPGRPVALIGPLSPVELGIILLILIVIFGPKRLPGVGRSLGQGMREFKESITGKSSDPEESDEKQELPASVHQTQPVDRPSQTNAPASEAEANPVGRK